MNLDNCKIGIIGLGYMAGGLLEDLTKVVGVRIRLLATMTSGVCAG